MKYLVEGYVERYISVVVEADDIDEACDTVEEQQYLVDGKLEYIEITDILEYT